VSDIRGEGQQRGCRAGDEDEAGAGWWREGRKEGFCKVQYYI
jgi:hypothetical protein